MKAHTQIGSKKTRPERGIQAKSMSCCIFENRQVEHRWKYNKCLRKILGIHKKNKKKMSLDMFPYKWVPKSGSCFWFCSCSCSCFCFCSCSCSCSCSWSWSCSCPPFCHRSLATTNQPQTHSDIKASQPASHQTSKHHSDCRSSRLVQQQANSKAKKQPSNHTSKLIQSSFYIYFSAFRASPLAKEERFINIKYYNAIKGERSPNCFF